MNPIKTLGIIASSVVTTLILLILIVNFAPMKIANLFLNPMGVVEGLKYQQEQTYQKEVAANAEKLKDILKNNRNEIFDQSAPFFGAQNAKAQIVIFSDYRCGYCRALAQMTQNILKDKEFEGKVKFIVKDLPILGPSSGILAIAGIEGFKAKPAKFANLHHDLFSINDDQLTIIAKVKEITGSTINLEGNAETMNSIQKNISLAQQLNIRGTPAIIIGEELIGGLIPEEDFKNKIRQELNK